MQIYGTLRNCFATWSSERGRHHLWRSSASKLRWAMWVVGLVMRWNRNDVVSCRLCVFVCTYAHVFCVCVCLFCVWVLKCTVLWIRMYNRLQVHPPWVGGDKNAFGIRQYGNTFLLSPCCPLEFKFLNGSSNYQHINATPCLFWLDNKHAFVKWNTYCYRVASCASVLMCKTRE